MKILYFDIVGGIAGDMTVASLIGLGVPLEYLRDGLAQLGVEGIAIDTEAAARHHIAGLRFVVTGASTASNSASINPQTKHPPNVDPPAENPPNLNPPTEDPPREASHTHARHKGHPHRPYRVIRDLLSQAGLPQGAAAIAQRIFQRLAEAEGAVHGVSPDEVEFHEVGAWDSIADVVCTALALDRLAPDKVYCSVVPLGCGMVKTAHGTMPVPAPATLELLRGFPVEQGAPAFERTTPTGAAILAAVAIPAPPAFRFVPERVGIGIGTADPPEVPNLLRAVWATEETNADAGVALPPATTERIECAEVNLDDANPEWIGYLMERLLDAGALDVVLIPVHMKKNRPGTLLQAIYAPHLRGAVQALLFAESTTLGVRYFPLERAVLEREAVTVATPWGQVAGKVAHHGGSVRFAPEYESCRAIALREKVPLREVYRAAQAAFAPDGH